MADTITLTKLDSGAQAIIDRFAEQTGLEVEDRGTTCVFSVEGHGEVHVTKVLDAIDPDWPAHVGFADPP